MPLGREILLIRIKQIMNEHLFKNALEKELREIIPDNETRIAVIAELDVLSNLIIDVYLEEKNSKEAKWQRQ